MNPINSNKNHLTKYAWLFKRLTGESGEWQSPLKSCAHRRLSTRTNPKTLTFLPHTNYSFVETLFLITFSSYFLIFIPYCQSSLLMHGLPIIS